MSSIEVRELTKRYANGATPALDAVSFTVEQATITCLLGPSGSGKSTALGCIAGLVAPDAGSVHVGGRDVTTLAPHRRPTTLLMQDAQLFAHLSVADNVAFGLRVRKVAVAQRRRRAHELLELVGLAGMGDRAPSELSGGEQQRVALARALAVEPAALLADEPLSSLDPSVRRDLQELLRQVHRELGTTMVVVTHDLDEAFALADRLVVLAAGRVAGAGRPTELVARPGSRVAAELLGVRTFVHHGDIATHAIHPRHVRVVAAEHAVHRGVITATRLLGTDVELTVAVDGRPMFAVVANNSHAIGDLVGVELPPEHLSVLTG